MMATTQGTVLTVDRARAALKDTLKTLSSPENVAKINEAKNNAGNDMHLYMQFVFPLITQIQMEIIKNYDFTSDEEGLLQFTRTVKMLRKESLEVSYLDDNLRQLLLPPLSLPCAPPPGQP